MQEAGGSVADTAAGSASAAQRTSAAGPDGERLPDGFTWHGYLVQLLHIASSIEHALMVQYLFAAYSLDDENPRLEPDERRKVAQWRNLILSVAKEEMGHLLTVQNVLCLLGGQLELVRENYPFDSAFYPFRFRLEPLSLGSLACYTFAEMGEIPRGDEGFRDRIVNLVEEHLSGREEEESLKKKDLRVRDAHQVGRLYERIIEILKDPKYIPDSAFSHNSVLFQASPDEWGRGYGIGGPPPREDDDFHRGSEKLQKRIADGATHAAVMIETAATRQQALNVLNRIAVQGEGRGVEPDSHYMRFRSIMQDLLDGVCKLSTHAMAENPLIRWPDVPDDATGNQITHPLSEKWGNMFNLRYRMLLTYLSHSFQLAREGSAARLRGAVIHRVFAEMYNIKAIAGILVRLPLTNWTKRERAGPPFQMPYTLAISMDPMDRWQQHRDLLRGALDLNGVLRGYLKRRVDRIDAIQKHCSWINRFLKFNRSLDAEFLGSNLEFLNAMGELDRKSHDWIGKVIAGMAREEAPQP